MWPNNGSFRATTHPYRINFQYSTHVCEHTKPSTPFYGFEFVKFEDVIGFKIDQNCLVGMYISLSIFICFIFVSITLINEFFFLIDVIGKLSAISDFHDPNSEESKSKRVSLQLKDLEYVYLE